MEGTSTQVSSRVLTVPNALSMLRLLGVPVFLHLLVTGSDGWALIVLVLSAVTDYLDGKIARTFNLVSRLGQILDPVADRLYILSTLLGLLWRGIIPWWLVALVVGRDVLLAVIMALLKRVGQTGLPVHVVGKAATLNLLYAFPLLLLGTFPGALGTVARVVGWAFSWWGVYLYWVAAGMYAVQAARVLRSRRASAEAGP
jgi:cardiolipin synthase